MMLTTRYDDNIEIDFEGIWTTQEHAFRSYDLDLDQITLIYEVHLDVLKMYLRAKKRTIIFIVKDFRVLELYRQTYKVTDTHRQTRPKHYPAAFTDKKLISRWDSERELFYDDIVHVLQNTIDSCINSATDRRGYALERTFTKFSEMTQYNGHYTVQGHSRSPILVPIESSYTTSY